MNDVQRFRKRPIEIEAVQLFRTNAAAIRDWINSGNPAHPATVGVKDLGRGIRGIGGVEIRLQTLEGIMTASNGDWIVKGVNGEFYPIKPDIFEKTYELAE